MGDIKGYFKVYRLGVVGGHGSIMVYTGDAGFHGGHQGGLQGAQIGGIVLAPCQPLPGWWVGVVHTGDADFHNGHQGGLQGAQIGGIVLAPCQSS